MDEQKRPGRSILAVLAGIVVGAVASLALDSLFRALGVFPPLTQVEPMSDAMFALATAYRIGCAVLGAWLAGVLAPNRVMGHALVCGAVDFVLCLAGLLATWSHVPSLGPHWYPIALAATALPSAWAGGKLAERRRQAIG